MIRSIHVSVMMTQVFILGIYVSACCVVCLYFVVVFGGREKYRSSLYVCLDWLYFFYLGQCGKRKEMWVWISVFVIILNNNKLYKRKKKCRECRDMRWCG
eukprot:UN01883